MPPPPLAPLMRSGEILRPDNEPRLLLEGFDDDEELLDASELDETDDEVIFSLPVSGV